MEDTLNYRAQFDNTQVNRAFDQLMAKVRQTATITNRDSSAIRASLQRIQNVQVRSAMLDGFNRQMRETQGGTERASSSIRSAIGSAMDEVRSRAASATPAVGGLVSSLTKMGPTAVVIGTVALAIAAVGSEAIKAAAQTQKWMGQLETVTKSSTKAKETYAALVKFASTTPFDLGQSVDAFNKLRMLGLAATEERLTSFGNTASAMGKSLNQMIEAVADASTGEFERLKEFGIKSKTEGDKVAFTFQGVTTKVAKNSTEITKYLENIGKTTFGGAMAKQMDSLNGAFSNVADNTQQMLSAIGEGALGTAVKEIAKGIANGISLLTPFFASIGNLFGGIIQGVGNVLNGLGQMSQGAGHASALQGVLEALTITFNLLGQGVTVLGSIVGAVFGAIGSIIGKVRSFIAESIGSLLNWMGISFNQGGRSWANSIVGILRAAKYVALSLPQIFAAAINDISAMFRGLGNVISMVWNARSLGDLQKAVGAAKGVAKGAGSNTRRVVGGVVTNASNIYADEKGAGRTINRLRGIGGVAPKLDSGSDAPPPKPDGKNDKNRNKDKSDEQKKAEADAKKYAEAVTNLKNRIADLALTEEQKALADEMERAGLKRDIKLTGEKANEIRNLFKDLKDGEQQKKVTEIMKDFDKSIRELGYSQIQLAQVEARRRAGLPEDLAITTDLTRKIDAQAAAYYNLQKAKENAKALKDVERDQAARKQEQEFTALGRTDPEKAEDARAVAQIERDRQANIEKITALEGITEARRAELVATENVLAAQDKQNVVLDRQRQHVEQLSDFLTNLWDNPKETMRKFFQDLMKRLIEAILKAALLGDKLGGGGGIGGLLKTVVGGALGIGAGRATGGSVKAGDIRPVGEGGAELVKFGAAGTVFNANQTRRALGGASASISFGETHMHFNGPVNQDVQAQVKSMMAQQQREQMDAMDAWAKKRGIR
jgi:hypothetical protein